MIAQLKSGGEVAPIDLHTLDDEIRAGRLSPSDALQHPPWTGSEFRALGEIPELAEAFDAPAARLAAHFDHLPKPWATVLGVGALTALSVALLLTGSEGALAPVWEFGAQGFEGIVLDRGWWRPWSSQFLHAGAGHLLGNLAVIAYSGWRVERALGWRGWLAVAAASVWMGALAVAGFQRMPVIGSSVLAFGLWGAQLAIGFRFGDALPESQRRFYGYGNLIFFAILAGQTLYLDNVSHLAHGGGLVGGALVAFLAKPPHLVPRTRARRAARMLEGASLALLLASTTVGPTLRAVPYLSWWPPRAMDLPEEGVTITLPGRLLPEDPTRTHTLTVRGMPAWSTSASSSEVVFCGLEALRWDLAVAGDPLTGTVLESWWSDRIAGTAQAVEAPPPRGPGWTSHALAFHDESGEPRYLVVEQHLLRGRWLNRVGYVVALEGDKPGPRAPVFDRIVASVQIGEPPTLAAARDAHLRNETSERMRLELARALHDAGDFEQADAFYGLVIAQGGRLMYTAVTERLEMQRLHADAFPPAEDPWFMAWIATWPDHRSLNKDAVLLLAHHGRCEEARALHDGLATLRPDAVELVATAGAVLSCEGRY